VHLSVVRILHPPLPRDAGPLRGWLARARAANAAGLAAGFTAAGAGDARLVSDEAPETRQADEAGRPAGRAFGDRLRAIAAALPDDAGLVILGSGSIPLASQRDLAALVGVAASGAPIALTNNRHSSDVIALGRAAALRDVPAELASDNGLPRWLAEVAGLEVRELPSPARLAMDLDSPLDLLLLGRDAPAWLEVELDPWRQRRQAVRLATRDPGAELVVAGRTSARTLGWLERSTASRTRALVEERGLRSSSPPARRRVAGVAAGRPPRSVLGLLLDSAGPGSLGEILSQLGDAAVVDTRVLLAHRLGSDEQAWPSPEDRFAADLLLPDRIVDPWLEAITRAALAAPIPVLFGGHSLVGPGIRFLLRGHGPGSRR
jgi:CTP:molybdopterin cytidylyltransferase MocA